MFIYVYMNYWRDKIIIEWITHCKYMYIFSIVGISTIVWIINKYIFLDEYCRVY